MKDNPLLILKKSTWLELFALLKISLLSRILCFFSCAALFVWLVTGVFTWFSGKEYIDTFFDTQQILFAKNFAVMNFEPTVNALPKTKALLAGRGKAGEEEDDALSFAIFSKEGNLLFTDGEDGQDFYFLPNTIGFVNVRIEDEIWRMFWVESLDKERIIAVGQELDYREDMILEILIGQLLPWIFSLPILLCALFYFLYKETIPLRSMTKNLNARKSDDISPLAVDNIALEIRPLVKSLNALFVRTGALLENQRNFVSNAAHELRTPLAGLAIQAEVISLCGDDEEAREHALEKLLQGIKRSTRLIDQLLLLSSIENKDIVDEKSQGSWQKLLSSAISEASEKTEEQGIEILYTATNEEIILKHAELWAIAFRNLLDNAIRYTKDIENEKKIYIHLSNKALVIENSAEKIDTQILGKLGERFYRQHGQSVQGTGLGLAIVGHICQINEAKFIIDNAIKDEKKDYLDKEFKLHVDGIVCAILF